VPVAVIGYEFWDRRFGQDPAVIGKVIRIEGTHSHLPGWVRAPKQITDGHLSKLATAKGAVLATLDERIPGSYRIPG
jgi:hypothetical protein